MWCSRVSAFNYWQIQFVFFTNHHNLLFSHSISAPKIRDYIIKSHNLTKISLKVTIWTEPKKPQEGCLWSDFCNMVAITYVLMQMRSCDLSCDLLCLICTWKSKAITCKKNSSSWQPGKMVAAPTPLQLFYDCNTLHARLLTSHANSIHIIIWDRLNLYSCSMHIFR